MIPETAARSDATPVRYGARDGSSPSGLDARLCPVCAAPLPAARARYCSEACKQRAYRLRQTARSAPDPQALRTELRRLRALAAQTLYECPVCAERYLGVQRCPACQRFCRALGLGGTCPHCDQPILVTEWLP